MPREDKDMKELHISGISSTTKNKMAILLLLYFLLLPAEVGAGAHDHDRDRDDECMPARCGSGPEIRFPFWLKDHQPERCGYGPEFALTCSPTNNSETLVDIPFFIKGVVNEINYLLEYIRYEFRSCFPQQNNVRSIMNTSPFIYRYRGYSTDVCEYHIFRCPSTPSSLDPYVNDQYTPLPCLGPGHHLYLVNSDISIRRNLLNCTKMHTIPSVPCIDLESLNFSGNDYEARCGWNGPFGCQRCEEKGKYCRPSSSNNSKEQYDQTECFDIPKPPIRKGETKSPHHVTGLIPTSLVVLVVLVIATYFAYGTNNSMEEDQVNVERFLENYRALKPTRYTFAEIKKITHNLKEKLGQGGYGTVYKGELSNDIPIAAKILNNDFTGNGEDFINEVGTIGTVHHVNVVRLVGYCADGYKKALVYEYLPNDSLDKLISSDHKKASLGSEKLQDIALGIAKGIEYLHQGCDQRILHFDIKPHNILLDKNFIPKISDFGLAKLCSKEQSVVSMTAARGTVGYIAPEVFSRNFGNVSHKSDVYSFGMVLLEMVGGRKKHTDVHAEEKNGDEVYFPEWIYNHLKREEANNKQIEEGGDAKIVKKLTIIGLWCIQWYPVDRPSMKVVVQMLEGDGETLVMPQNPFSTTSRSITRGNMGGRPFSSMLEIISESD